MKLLFLILCSIQFISNMVIYPEKLETISYNNHDFHNIKFTYRKHGRHSPYYLDFDYNATSGYGNNLTIKWELYEYISGRFIQIPVQFEYKLCDFLYKDKLFGQMYAKQLQGNWSCPFPPGRSPFRNLVMHTENVPTIPFTYSSLIVRTRTDITIFMGPPIKEIALLKIFFTLRQSL